MSDELSAYHLIIPGNLTTRYAKLVRPTFNKLRYDVVKIKLIKTFSKW